MNKEMKAALDEQRNILLREAKREKSADYKSGYVNGALDMFNQAVVVIETYERE